MFLETNPIPVKNAYRMMGLAVGPLRMPLACMAEEKEVEKILKEIIGGMGEYP